MRRSDREAAISKVPRRPTLVSSTMESLKAFLTEQGFEIGDRLPSQDALVRSLGVSRTVVREAVKGLEMLGIVRSSHGEGVFFTGPSRDGGDTVRHVVQGERRGGLPGLRLRVSQGVGSVSP